MPTRALADWMKKNLYPVTTALDVMAAQTEAANMKESAQKWREIKYELLRLVDRIEVEDREPST